MKIAGSPLPVADTVDGLMAALAKRGINVFARIDHAAGAREAGLELADEQVLVFGDPRVGTLLMQEDATIGYELPLRLLVWDDGGATKIGWRPPTELSGEYRIALHAEVLQGMEGLLEQLVAEATSA